MASPSRRQIGRLRPFQLPEQRRRYAKIRRRGDR